jgi:hypothetical protein
MRLPASVTSIIEKVKERSQQNQDRNPDCKLLEV